MEVVAVYSPTTNHLRHQHDVRTRHALELLCVWEGGGLGVERVMIRVRVRVEGEG